MKILCSIPLIGHAWRESSPEEKKAAAKEVEQSKRTVEDLPVQVCRRCGVAWGFRFGVQISMPTLEGTNATAR